MALNRQKDRQQQFEVKSILQARVRDRQAVEETDGKQLAGGWDSCVPLECSVISRSGVLFRPKPNSVLVESCPQAFLPPQRAFVRACRPLTPLCCSHIGLGTKAASSFNRPLLPIKRLDVLAMCGELRHM